MERVDPLDDAAWDWGGAARTPDMLARRRCVRLAGPGLLARPHEVDLVAGVLEADVAVEAGRSFHGLAWRIADETSYESFFVRPHQIGNPDAVQYTPVSNGVSSWQLYHGDGFWYPAVFPIGAWFTIRVEFAEATLRAQVGGAVVLEATRLRQPARAGGVGVLVGGDDLLLGEVRWSDEVPRLPPPAPEPSSDEIIACWEVSDPFAECDLAAQLSADHDWTPLVTEPSGLADLARLNPVREGANTVLARAVVQSDRARTVALELGFSDRAVVHLNGRPLYRGDDTYRSRDYRFLGSIGWHDAVWLPLEAGRNELVVAVSESFGGWGLQARFPEADGLEFPRPAS
jgi:hypothetical protein